MTVIDDYSRKNKVYFLKTKVEDEVFGWFKEWNTIVEKQTRNLLRSLIIKNGLDFCKATFENFCKKEGIVRHRNVQQSTHQRGVVEQMNKTLVERAQRMQLIADLSNQLWSEAVNAA